MGQFPIQQDKKSLWNINILKSNCRNVEIDTYSMDALLMSDIAEVVADTIALLLKHVKNIQFLTIKLEM